MTWWRGQTLVDSSWEEEAGGAVVNQLTAGPLSRDDLDASYTCWAANHKQSLPKATKVDIDMLRECSDSYLGFEFHCR